MTTTLATAPAQRRPLVQDEEISHQVGRVVITLKCVRLGAAYTVTCYRGTLRIEDNCTALDDEDDARVVARGYANLYAIEAAQC